MSRGDTGLIDLNGGASTMQKWARIVMMLGAPTVIALWLVWVLTGELRSDARETRAITAATAVAVAEIKQEQSQTTAAVLSLLRQICINGASDVVQRTNCLNVQR